MERRTLLGLGASQDRKSPAPQPVGAGGGGSSAPASPYVRVPLVTATMVRSDGRNGVLSIEAGLDVADAALSTRAQQSLPRLRDAWSIEAQRAGQAMRPGTAPDVEALARALQSATDRVLGRAGARVLLGTVMAV